MELVYLWVEKYKNIHKQGFNFSGRFKCDFDGENLTIDENKEYVHLFPDNINVTAIVGKNGSGKSNIFKFIRLVLQNEGWYREYDGLIVFFEPKTKKIILLDLSHESVICPSCSKNIHYYDDLNKFLRQIIFPSFDYSLIYNLSDYTRKSDTVKRHFPTFPEKFTKIDLLKEERESIKKLLINFHSIKKENNWGIFESFFKPFQIRVYINFRKFPIDNLIKEKQNEAKKLKNKILENFQQNEYRNALKNLELLSEMTSTFSYMGSVDAIKNIDDMVTLQFNQLTEKLLKKNHFNAFKKDTINGEFNTQCIFEWNVEEISNNEVVSIVESFLQPYFHIEILDVNQKKFSDLSFGEQQLLNILNGLYYFGSKEYIELVTKIEKNGAAMDGKIHDEIEYDEHITLPIQNFVIFLDEIELGLHPRWQTESIKYILNFLSNIKSRNFHLIISSHSPFILSDIPKENVIFLNKFTDDDIEVKTGVQKKGNCKNVSETVDIKQTFGANMHTLLSHGFFMKEGLIGEFAKDKINNVVKLLKSKRKLSSKNLKHCEDIISIIGEPVLQKTLQGMLDEKKSSHLSKLEKLKIQQKEIEVQIKALEEDQ